MKKIILLFATISLLACEKVQTQEELINPYEFYSQYLVGEWNEYSVKTQYEMYHIVHYFDFKTDTTLTYRRTRDNELALEYIAIPFVFSRDIITDKYQWYTVTGVLEGMERSIISLRVSNDTLYCKDGSIAEGFLLKKTPAMERLIAMYSQFWGKWELIDRTNDTTYSIGVKISCPVYERVWNYAAMALTEDTITFKYSTLGDKIYFYRFEDNKLYLTGKNHSGELIFERVGE